MPGWAVTVARSQQRRAYSGNSKGEAMRTIQMWVAVGVVAGLWSVSAGADQPAGQPSQRREQPVQLALFPPKLQLVPENESIRGFRLNIYGRNHDVGGVDIGLVHEASGNFHGIAFGVAHMVRGEAGGLQLSGIYSEAAVRISGVQVGMFNRSAMVRGVQIGLVNLADDMVGFQFGLFNEIRSKQVLPVLPVINAKF
jgi:hypothetical protein